MTHYHDLLSSRKKVEKLQRPDKSCGLAPAPTAGAPALVASAFVAVVLADANQLVVVHHASSCISPPTAR